MSRFDAETNERIRRQVRRDMRRVWLGLGVVLAYSTACAFVMVLGLGLLGSWWLLAFPVLIAIGIPVWEWSLSKP